MEKDEEIYPCHVCGVSEKWVFGTDSYVLWARASENDPRWYLTKNHDIFIRNACGGDRLCEKCYKWAISIFGSKFLKTWSF